MSGLSRNARALIDAAVRHEPLPSEAQMGRVRGAVLRRFAGAAGAAGTASLLVTKAAAFGASVTAQVATYAAIGAVAGASVLAIGASQATKHESAPVKANVTTADRLPSVAAPPADVAAKSHVSGYSTPPDVPPLRVFRGVAQHRPGSPAEDDPGNIGAGEGTSSGGVAAPSMAPRAGADPAPVQRQRSLEGTSGERSPAARASADRGELVPGEAASRGESASNDLARQIDVLHRMRAELRAGHPREVLELARRSEALFEGSALEAESRAARIAALCRLGLTGEARREIDRFRRMYPASPLIPRVEESCADPNFAERLR